MNPGAALPALEVLYEQAGCGLLVTDTGGLVLRANATLCGWLGFASSELVGRMRIAQLLPIGARLFHQTHCEPILQVQGSLAELQVELFDSRRERVPMLVNIARRRHGDVLLDEWALFVVKDRRSYERELLAARKSAERALAAQLEAEQQLLALNAALSDADRRKDEFLATLSHELRNPLAPMRSALEVLKLGLGRPGGLPPARLLDMFDRQLHQLTHLVDDLMDVSRITQNRMELRLARVTLTDILQGAAQDAASMMAAAGHTLEVTLPERELIVDADATRLTQVVVNLLTNAAKYTPDGGRIRLRAWDEGGEALIEVSDNGIGIPAHALDTVFGMFSQLKPALDRSKGGLGIGLALVRGILALHGGGIRAHSEGEGRGSSFTVNLPLAEETAVPAGAAPAAPADAVNPVNVLVVDDNVDAAETLMMFLEMSGCTVRTAHSGAGALAVLTEGMPRVALFDIGLPDTTGYELARRVRALPGGGDVMLIAATGWGQDSDRQRATEAGFDHHLTKPIDFGKLRALMGSCRPA